MKKTPTLAIRWLRPGTRAMRRLSMPGKLGVMAATALVPLFVMIWLASAPLVGKLLQLRHQQAGALATRDAVNVFAELAALDELNSRRIAGDRTADGLSRTVQSRLSGAVQAMDARLAGIDDSRSRSIWDDLRPRAMAAAKATPADGAVDDNEALRSALLSATTLVSAIGEASGLRLTDDAARLVLADVSLNQVVPWIAKQGEVVHHGARLLAGTEVQADREALRVQVAALRRRGEAMQAAIAALERTGVPNPLAWSTARANASRLVSMGEGAANAEAAGLDSAEFISVAEAATETALRLSVDVSSLHEQSLLRAEAGVRQQLLVYLLLALASVCTLGYFAFAFYRSLMGSIGALLRGVEGAAEGDLSRPLGVTGEDEVADIGRHVDRMAARLSMMVAEIRSSAARVGQVGQSIVDEGQALSARTEIQASSLRESVSVVNQLGRAIAAGADSARSIEMLADSLRGKTRHGNEAIASAVASIAALENSARRVSEINDVIDDIAHQTNLLALNASVEAARAGEGGKGFAVVAGEVRQLALRCAASAAEIRGLIDQTREHVDASATSIRQVGTSLGGMTGDVDDVSSRLRTLATASEDHSQRLEMVVANVGQMNEVTRENAESVRRAQAASGLLAEQARSLQDAVASVRLREGTIDEAKLLVQRARTLVLDAGLDEAAATLHDADGPYIDRDLAIFVFDREGTVLAMGSRPQEVGLRLHDLPRFASTAADAFLADSWRSAEAGGGWVEYEVLRDNGEAQRKTAYIAPLDGQSFIGCGVQRRASVEELESNADGVRDSVLPAADGLVLA